MSLADHHEKHFQGGDTVKDIVIGMADGLTVPFALAAGISGAVAQTHLVVTAGFAEIAAGSIAMGLGGYLAAKSDLEHFQSEQKREEEEIEGEVYRCFALEERGANILLGGLAAGAAYGLAKLIS
jgi:vacuolar iron transporter family protein